MAPRRYLHRTAVALADAAPDGRARLDAVARWLQDAAFGDVTDAGVADDGAWIVRRLRVDVARLPRFGEPLALTTWCSGLGRMWAERRTTLPGIEAVAIWVHLDPGTGRPRPLGEQQLALWGPSAGDRRVKARLSHPGPSADADAASFSFRVSDLDVAGHVNNAAYWTVLDATPAEPFAAEIEFRGGARAGPAEVLCDGARRWVLGADGEVAASLDLDPASTVST